MSQKDKYVWIVQWKYDNCTQIFYSEEEMQKEISEAYKYTGEGASVTKTLVISEEEV